MFWSSKKKVPAPQHKRYDLARILYLQRVDADSSLETIAEMMGADARAYTGEQVFSLGFPEGSIIGMTEQYIILQERGMDENGIVQTMSKYFSTQLLPDGRYPPTVPEGTSFMTYLSEFVEVTGGRFRVDDEVLRSHVKAIRTFYDR